MIDNTLRSLLAFTLLALPALATACGGPIINPCQGMTLRVVDAMGQTIRIAGADAGPLGNELAADECTRLCGTAGTTMRCRSAAEQGGGAAAVCFDQTFCE